MRPQRIVSYLSLNVIIHLEVKLNYKKILENGWISKSKKGSCNIFDSKIKKNPISFFQQKSVCNLPPFEAIFESKLPLFFDHFLYLKYRLRRLFFYRKTHCLHSTKYHENNAFCIFDGTIFIFDFECP